MVSMSGGRGPNWKIGVVEDSIRVVVAEEQEKTEAGVFAETGVDGAVILEVVVAMVPCAL